MARPSLVSLRDAERLLMRAGGARWGLAAETFRAALEASTQRAFDGRVPDPAAVARYLETLRLDDLALACACASGHDAAWEHVVLTFRPQLYRAADAMDSTGGARDLADALYADLFVAPAGDSVPRRSLFRYFHGRSSLATWLRSVLAQRYVDRVRAGRRTQALPDEDSAHALRAATPEEHGERGRFLALMRAALAAALALLAPKDRLRIGCYYAQGMTLAQVGRLTGESEATVSRQLARTRTDLGRHIDAYLHDPGGLDESGRHECWSAVAGDSGPIDLGRLLAEAGGPPRAARNPGGPVQGVEDQA